MANLTNCADCGREVSRRAATCPHCGAPLVEQGAAPRARLEQVRLAERVQTYGLAAILAISVLLALYARSKHSEDWALIGLFGALVSGILLLGGLPGSIARSRGHPNAQAITVCAWCGLLFTVGLLWFVALIWAYMAPSRDRR